MELLKNVDAGWLNLSSWPASVHRGQRSIIIHQQQYTQIFTAVSFPIEMFSVGSSVTRMMDSYRLWLFWK